MSGINIFVHPQAMLVLSNHYARRPYDIAENPLKYHCGLLLGNYDGPKIVVTSALELVINERGDRLKVDPQYYETESQLRSSIYPNDVPIGWYIIHKVEKSELNAISDAISAGVSNFENLIFGEFFPFEENKPPLQLYEPKGDDYLPVDYSYESENAERIAMMQLQSEGNAENQIQFTAKGYKSLDSDLAIIEKYIQMVTNNEIPFEPVLMRSCANIAQWWDHSFAKRKTDGNTENEEEEEEDDDIEEQVSVALLAGTMLETMTEYQKREKSNNKI